MVSGESRGDTELERTLFSGAGEAGTRDLTNYPPSCAPDSADPFAPVASCRTSDSAAPNPSIHKNAPVTPLPRRVDPSRPFPCRQSPREYCAHRIVGLFGTDVSGTRRGKKFNAQFFQKFGKSVTGVVRIVNFCRERLTLPHPPANPVTS